MTCLVCVDAPLTEVIVSGYEPEVPAAGLPVMTAAPGVAVNVTPAGSVPVREMVGVGVPVAVALIVPTLPTTNAVLPVTVRTDGVGVTVVVPELSHPLTSPPYDSSVAPAIVVPVGAVIGTATAPGFVTVI